MRKDAALLVLVLSVLSLLAVPAARAGTYDVVACNAPGAEARNASWTLEPYNALGRPAPDASAFAVITGPDVCDPTSGIGFTTLTERRVLKLGDGAAWTFRAPTGTTVKRMQLWRNSATRVSGSSAPENGWWTMFLRAGDGPAGKVVFGNETCPGNVPGADGYCRRGGAGFSPATLVAYDVGEPVVSLALECSGATPATLCATGTGAAGGNHGGLQMQGAVMTIDDPVAPVVSAALPDAGYGRQSTPLVLDASDSSGIRAVKVLVDGVERVGERYECDFRKPSPCPVTAARAFDLTGVADGRHAITLLAEDAASNITRIERVVELDGTAPAVEKVPVSGRKVTVHVSDALSGVAGGTIEVRDKRDAPFTALKTTLRGGRLTASVPRSFAMSRLGIRVAVSDKAGNAFSAAVTSMSLSTRIGKRASRKVRNERASVPYGRDATVLGRLTTTDGVPLAGQPIELKGVLRRTGAAAEPVASAVTDSDGRFSVVIPAGPSRVLTVAFAGTNGLLHRARDVALRVPAHSTIRASATSLRGAGTIRFSGRLGTLGTAFPPGGKLVDLQASQRGRWSTVATTRTRGADGSWRAVARFRGTPGRFGIRLRIRREALFPYELGYSASVVVRVR